MIDEIYEIWPIKNPVLSNSGYPIRGSHMLRKRSCYMPIIFGSSHLTLSSDIDAFVASGALVIII